MNLNELRKRTIAKEKAMERAREGARELRRKIDAYITCDGEWDTEEQAQEIIIDALLEFRKEGLAELRQEVLDRMTLIVLECIHDEVKEMPIVQKRVSEGLAHAFGKMGGTEIL